MWVQPTLRVDMLVTYALHVACQGQESDAMAVVSWHGCLQFARQPVHVNMQACHTLPYAFQQF